MGSEQLEIENELPIAPEKIFSKEEIKNFSDLVQRKEGLSNNLKKLVRYAGEVNNEGADGDILKESLYRDTLSLEKDLAEIGGMVKKISDILKTENGRKAEDQKNPDIIPPTTKERVKKQGEILSGIKTISGNEEKK